MISAIRGTLPSKVLEFHRKYGPVVRLAPDELAFSDAAAWNDIQGLLPDRRQNRKDSQVYGPIERGYERSIIHAKDGDHAKLRRIYGPAFVPRALEEQADMLIKYANLLVKNLTNAVSSNPIQDISTWFNFATFDLMGQFAFDDSFHYLDEGAKEDSFVHLIVRGIITAFRLGQLDRYGIWTILKPLLPRSVFKAKDEMDNYVAELTDRRKERGYVPGKIDVFNYILQNKTDQDHLTRDELTNNGLTLVVAGSETTATLLAATTWQLCKNKAAYRKVVE